VFAERFTFRDIYVPPKAKPVDKNGHVVETLHATSLYKIGQRIFSTIPSNKIG
jgi:hypothetical protein